MSQKSNVTVIGLVGGIASGKSTVASVLSELGATVIDADQLGHEVLEQPLIVRRLTQEFGEGILVESDKPRIDRDSLGRLVFGEDPSSQAALQKLEDIVHPVIHAEAIRRLRAIKESDHPPKAVVIDAPLLIEAGWAPMCDIIIFVETPDEVRAQRSILRGWSVEHFRRREATQLSLDEKRQAATHQVNSIDRDMLRRELAALWEQF
ncbi:MAG: dephospho-CoA kinase [Aureliella sp.]